jgi:Domain of unknown function (DUF5615)
LRIFADENVPTLVVEGLRAVGHDVTWGCEFGQGAPDADRLAEAHHEGRVILTEDNDFAELAIGRGFATRGLVRFDLPGLRRETKAARILEAMIAISDDAIGRVHVIEHARIRSRAIE